MERFYFELKSNKTLDKFISGVKQDVLAWIDSGIELCRLEKPATPNKHLVSYFALVDDDYLLLVDHINAQLWLPTGGHVEPDEHPPATALRELKEELSVEGEFLYQAPILVTSTPTVGKTAGHIDVSLWYAIKGDRNQDYQFDRSEFYTIQWFHKNKLPLERADPELHRFVAKLYT